MSSNERVPTRDYKVSITGSINHVCALFPAIINFTRALYVRGGVMRCSRACKTETPFLSDLLVDDDDNDDNDRYHMHRKQAFNEAIECEGE